MPEPKTLDQFCLRTAQEVELVILFSDEYMKIKDLVGAYLTGRAQEDFKRDVKTQLDCAQGLLAEYKGFIHAQDFDPLKNDVYPLEKVEAQIHKIREYLVS